jgi:hypothetical protein
MGRRRIQIEKKKKKKKKKKGCGRMGMGMTGKSKMRVLDIVYRALGLGVSKTRWVLMMMIAEGVSSMGGWWMLVSQCVRSASASDSLLFSLPAAVLGPGSEQVPTGRMDDHLVEWHSG